MPIYKIGNVLDADPPCVIAHIVNTKGVWGKVPSAGFVYQLEKKFSGVRQKYLDFHNANKISDTTELGDVQFVNHSGFVIANMFGQTFGVEDGQPPIRYIELQRCINSVQKFAHDHQLNVVCPRIGTGLAGGKWSIIVPLIPDEWTVYTLESEVHLFERGRQ